jgi:hypothetical protein
LKTLVGGYRRMGAEFEPKERGYAPMTMGGHGGPADRMIWNCFRPNRAKTPIIAGMGGKNPTIYGR